ncbi:hypothetical protein MK489_14090 [Myxococcota bacterium]|nr:hypothetical protein [Myxococcota bacterium]
MQERISVCFCNDHEQIELLYVAIKSLVSEFEKTHRNEVFALDIYIISIGLSDEMKRTIESCAGSSISVTRVIFLEYRLQGRYPLCRFRASEIVTLVFFAPEFFPDLERIIFLDSDVLITGDISELWDIDLRGRWLGIVDKAYDQSQRARTIMRPLSALTTPVNSGTVLLDLVKMRTENISHQLDSFMEKNQKWLRTPEQEAFEYVANNRIHLHHKWNWRGVAPVSEIYWSAPTMKSVAEYEAIVPSVVHFQWPARPNRYHLDNPWFDRWNDYYDLLGLNPLTKKAYDLLLFTRMSVGTHRLGSSKKMRILFRFSRHALVLLPTYIAYRLKLMGSRARALVKSNTIARPDSRPS